MSVVLRPHQEEVLPKMYDGCVLCGKPGSGKTFTALSYVKKNHPDRPLYVITTAKKRNTNDWVRDAAKLMFDPNKVVVDSWNNIGKYIDVKDAMFVFDEQRLVGDGAWVKSFLKLVKANNWILLTGTPGDDWSDYAPLFVARGWYKSVYEFKQKHAVYSRWTTYPKIERWTDEAMLLEYRDKLLVTMPMVSHTTRHFNNIVCHHDEELLTFVRKKRWNVYENKPLKNAGELFGALRKIVSSDPDRATKLVELAETHPRLIVFYNFDYELEILRETCQKIKNSRFWVGDDFSWAEYNGHKHQEVPESERWIYLVQYQSGSEAWDCTSTDSMVFWSLTYSWKQFDQAQGRIDRLNTPYTDLYYHILYSDSIAEKPVLAALSKKKNFQPRW